MQPPIPTGTILQNRYRLVSILGQGGFGRTYLAEDQGRFNERCALKELIPAQDSAYVLEKSRELFQREAATLYQIQHPQIPQFWATFEQEGRLFLVQEYVEGKTYATLLNERQAMGTTFLEAEVGQMLQQLLPVLAYIHSKGIIHRDISPDNIILRQRDLLPVLIDFGVVKELATRFQSPDMTMQATTVGKLGYAPSEQIQTGRAYPSSDLYALAVTAVVLLTGMDPTELFDDIQMNWEWRRWATVSNGFAQVLNRMLSYRPSDRYPSAGEVLQALQFLQNPLSGPQYSRPKPQPPDPSISQMKTIAVGQRQEPVYHTYRRRYSPAPGISKRSGSSIWEDPWAMLFIGLIVALLAGFCSWLVVSAILNNGEPTTSPTPDVFTSETPTALETPTPKPKPSPESYTQQLDLFPGQSVSKEGNLKENETINYIISGQQGQQLDTSLTSEGVLMTILGLDDKPVADDAKRVLGWQGTLPYTGDYKIQLSPIKGLAESDYKLDISLSESALVSPTLAPTPTLTPSESTSPAAAQFDTEKVNNFPRSGDAVTVSGQTSPQKIKRYLVNVENGQQLQVEVQQGFVTLDIRDPDGNLVENASGVLSWNDRLSRDGEYKIDVTATEETNFTLNVSVGE